MNELSLPNANSPRLLARLLEMVARGVRSSRGLQEALGVNLRTVQYYLRAGEWLGFIEPGGETRLSPLGLEYVYDVGHRRHVYSRAVWANGFVQELMAGRGADLPETIEIARAVVRAEAVAPAPCAACSSQPWDDAGPGAWTLPSSSSCPWRLRPAPPRPWPWTSRPGGTTTPTSIE